MRICVDLPLLSERTHRNCYSVCQSSFLFLNKGQELELVAEKSMNGAVSSLKKKRKKNFSSFFWMTVRLTRSCGMRESLASFVFALD